MAAQEHNLLVAVGHQFANQIDHLNLPAGDPRREWAIRVRNNSLNYHSLLQFLRGLNQDDMNALQQLMLLTFPDAIGILRLVPFLPDLLEGQISVRLNEFILKKLAYAGDLGGVRLAIANGVHIDTPNLHGVIDIDGRDIVQGIWQGITTFFNTGWPPAWRKSWHTSTPLILAAWAGHEHVVRFLLDDCDPPANLRHETDGGHNALYWARNPEEGRQVNPGLVAYLEQRMVVMRLVP